MTSDQLPPSTERHSPVALTLGAFGPTPEMGVSFGLGFAVRTDRITGTYFWVDPKEKLVVVLMLQIPQASDVDELMYNPFKNCGTESWLRRVSWATDFQPY